MADDGRLYCVNARGEVTYSLPCGERNATRLYGGVFLSYDGITARLRRADGSEVAVEGGTDKLDLLFLSGDTCLIMKRFVRASPRRSAGTLWRTSCSRTGTFWRCAPRTAGRAPCSSWASCG